MPGGDGHRGNEHTYLMLIVNMSISHGTRTAAPIILDQAAQNLLFHEGRTANTFTDEPVTDEQIAALHELVKWAPTAMNTQPLRVAVVRSTEAKARLLPHMAEGNRAKTEAAPGHRAAGRLAAHRGRAGHVRGRRGRTREHGRAHRQPAGRPCDPWAAVPRDSPPAR